MRTEGSIMRNDWMIMSPLETAMSIAVTVLVSAGFVMVRWADSKRDEIASRQILILRQFQGKHERPIKLHQVKQMFEEMRDESI